MHTDKNFSRGGATNIEQEIVLAVLGNEFQIFRKGKAKRRYISPLVRNFNVLSFQMSYESSD